MHDLPKPRFGGIAVFFGFAFALFTVLGIAFASRFDFFRQPINSMPRTGWSAFCSAASSFSASASGTTSCRSPAQ